MPTVKQYFTGNGSWTAPAGITCVGCVWGGGCGAGGGGTAQGAGGGGAAMQSFAFVSVTPGTAYTVTIGAGGTGVSNAAGNSGANTTFDTLYTFDGGGAGGVSLTQNPGIASKTGNYTTTAANTHLQHPGMGGWGGTAATYDPVSGATNVIGGFAGGAAGTVNATHNGGGGGGAGPQGVGAAGGAGSGAGAASNGSNASANTGAGGGGSGGGASGSGTGGNGGSGYLYVIWMDR